MTDGFRKCPYCNRFITSDATVCKHCGEMLGENNTQATSSQYAATDTVDLFEGLTYMFRDKNILPKFLSLAIVFSIMVLFSFSLRVKINSNVFYNGFFFEFVWTLLFGLIMWGYMISCVKNITQQSEVHELPTINFLGDFLTALKFAISIFLGVFFYLVIPILLSFLAQIFLGSFGMIMAGIIYLCYIIILPISIPAFVWIFAQKKYWTVIFRLKLLKNVLDKGLSRYVLALVLMNAAGIICLIPLLIIFFIFYKNIFIYLIFYSLFGAYGIYSSAYFIAKSISAEKLHLLP